MAEAETAAGEGPTRAPGLDQQSAAEHVPLGVRVAASWTWRLLVIAAGVVGLLLLLDRFRIFFGALFVALLLTAALNSLVGRVQRLVHRRGLAVSVVMVGALILLAAVAAFLAVAVSHQWSDLAAEFSDGVDKIRSYLQDTFGLSSTTLDGYVQRLRDSIRSNQGAVASGLLSGATVAAEVVTGAVIALLATVFFLNDGRRIWLWVVGLFPRRHQNAVREAFDQSWWVLGGYVRGTIIIAAVDATCIGLAIWLIGVPLAIPLAVLVFFGAFIPLVGAFVSGFVAVVVALAAKGPVAALLVLAAILLVQQLEGHLLQPLIMGRMVSLHPLGIIAAVTIGGILAGILGAVVAVPLTAIATTVFGYMGGRARRLADGEDPDRSPPPGGVGPLSDQVVGSGAGPVGAPEQGPDTELEPGQD